MGEKLNDLTLSLETVERCEAASAKPNWREYYESISIAIVAAFGEERSKCRFLNLI